MKILSIVALLVVLASCQNQTNQAADAAFKKNCETVRAYLKGWKSENVDYSIYASNFVMRNTSMGKDSVSLDEMKANDKNILAALDFNIEVDSVVLLPGVNSKTLQPDGSVRYYGDWQVTKPATDSTAAKSTIVKIYESFDFDADGKILFQQAYADFTGAMMYLNDGKK